MINSDLVLCPDMGQFDATKGKQALEIRSSLSERRALTDPILPGDSADISLAHNRQWAKAHGKSLTQAFWHKMFGLLHLRSHKTPMHYSDSHENYW